MKKLLCLILCLALIFSSVSLSFAVEDVSDATTHTQLGNIYNLLSGTSIAGRLNNINNHLDDINYNLVTLMGWIDPSTGGSTTALLNQILSMLSYTDAGGALKSWLADIWQQISLTEDNTFALTPTGLGQRSMTWLTNNNGQWIVTSVNTDFYSALTGNLNNLIYIETQNHNLTWPIISTNYNSVQSPRNWLDLTSGTFIPVSITDGVYNWLNSIQQPVARLSYVLASDERIAAQEAAAANEDAVVDNFIDSTGDGAASPSDIGSVSDLSSGYKQNFGTDASPSGIFDIFNSDHATWFSQETKNQLDTTTPTRLTKSSQSETPLLDKQIDDIYNALGVKQP